MIETEFASLRTTVEAMLGRMGAQENDTRRLHDDFSALEKDVAEMKTMLTQMAGDIKILERNSSTREQYLELSHGTKAIDTKVSSIDKAVAGVTETLNQFLREKSTDSSFTGVLMRWKEVIGFFLTLAAAYAMLRFGVKP